MSLVLQFGEEGNEEELSGLFYVNVVEDYNKEVKGSVSKHPLDSGVSAADHFIADNMSFQIKGVITSADITFAAHTTSFLPTGQSNIQATAPPPAVEIQGGDSLLSRFIPNVIGQFLSPLSPSAFGDGSEVVEFGMAFQDFIERMVLDVMYNPETQMYRNSIVPIKLYEMDLHNNITKAYYDLVMTSFRVRESADTGNGCHFDMQLEQARYMEILRGEIPDNVSSEIARQSAPPSNQGSEDSTELPVGGDDPQGPIRPQSQLSRMISGPAAGTTL